jgi:hypothetical protein
MAISGCMYLFEGQEPACMVATLMRVMYMVLQHSLA